MKWIVDTPSTVFTLNVQYALYLPYVQYDVACEKVYSKKIIRKIKNRYTSFRPFLMMRTAYGFFHSSYPKKRKINPYEHTAYEKILRFAKNLKMDTKNHSILRIHFAYGIQNTKHEADNIHILRSSQLLTIYSIKCKVWRSMTSRWSSMSWSRKLGWLWRQL